MVKMTTREQRIKDLKAELQKLESQGKLRKKTGIFKALGSSTKHVFKSLGAAGKQVLSDPNKNQSDSSDLDKIIRSLPA